MGLFSGPKTTTTQQQQTAQTGNQTQTGATTGFAGSGTQNSSTGNTQQTQGSQGNFAQSTTPNLPAWYQSFLQSIPGQYSSLSATLNQNAQKPLVGPQQEANFQQDLGKTTNQMSQTLQSQLASQGALNSGRADQSQTQLALGEGQQLADYKAGVPLTNADYQTKQNTLLGQLLGQQQGFTSPVSAYGSTTSGNNQQTSITDILNQLFGQSSTASGYGSSSNSSGTSASTSNSSGVGTSQTDPGLGGIIGGAAQGALGALGALGK